MREKIKIGLDVHGVIDRFPQEFGLLTKRWVNLCGFEVHIVTGQSWKEVRPQLDGMDQNGITYTHYFSIVDYNREIGTKMWEKESGWWMSQEDWDKTKGEYAKRVGLNIHFEDTLDYARWFPPSCTFIHVGSHFDKMLGVVGDFVNTFDLFRLSSNSDV